MHKAFYLVVVNHTLKFFFVNHFALLDQLFALCEGEVERPELSPVIGDTDTVEINRDDHTDEHNDEDDQTLFGI